MTYLYLILLVFLLGVVCGVAVLAQAIARLKFDSWEEFAVWIGIRDE